MLVVGERDQVAQRTLRDAERHRADVGRELEQRRAEQRLARERIAEEEIERPLLGDQRVADLDVVAAGATQARGAPGVVDGPGAGGQHRATQLRRARHRPRHRLAAAGDDAVAEQQARVLAAAGEAPASVDAVAALAAVDRFGRAARREGAADDDVGAVGIDRLEGRLR